MWQNTDLVFLYLGECGFYRSLQEYLSTNGKTLDVPHGPESQQAATRIINIFENVNIQMSLQPRVNGYSAETVWMGLFFKELKLLAGQISAGRFYSFLEELNSIIGLARVNYPGKLEEIFIIISRVLHLLVGDETKVLVGLEGNTPVYKTLRKPVKTLEDLAQIDLPVKSRLNWIHQDDVSFIPDPTDIFAMRPIINQIPIVDDLGPILALFRDTKANLCYTPDPDGIEVVIRGYPLVKSVVIKPKLLDSGVGFGLMTRVNFSNGSCFLVAPNPEAVHVESFGYNGRVHRFMYYLAYKIYHDFCTAKEDPPTTDRRTAIKDWQDTNRTGSNRAENYQPRYIYIQRRQNGVTGQVNPIRRKAKEHHIRPHWVVGHIRHGVKMSDAQRQRVLEFERNMGIDGQITAILSDNTTYILPYFKGNDPEDIKWAPIYVKADLKREIDEAFSRRPTK